MKTRSNTRFACMLLVAACLPALAAPPTVKTPPAAQPPTLHVTTFRGTTFDLAAQHGKWVLLYLWASWCPPCIKGMPTISSFVKAHPDVTAVGLDIDESNPAEAKRFLSRHTFDFPLAPLDKAHTAKLVGPAGAIPVIWIISPDGTASRALANGLDAHKLDQLMQNAGYRSP